MFALLIWSRWALDNWDNEHVETSKGPKISLLCTLYSLATRPKLPPSTWTMTHVNRTCTIHTPYMDTPYNHTMTPGERERGFTTRLFLIKKYESKNSHMVQWLFGFWNMILLLRFLMLFGAVLELALPLVLFKRKCFLIYYCIRSYCILFSRCFLIVLRHPTHSPFAPPYSNPYQFSTIYFFFAVWRWL